MWKCKHCNKKFDYNTTSEKANHSRWCDDNPNRNSGNHIFSTLQDKRHGVKK